MSPLSLATSRWKSESAFISHTTVWPGVCPAQLAVGYCEQAAILNSPVFNAFNIKKTNIFCVDCQGLMLRPAVQLISDSGTTALSSLHFPGVAVCKGKIAGMVLPATARFAKSPGSPDRWWLATSSPSVHRSSDSPKTQFGLVILLTTKRSADCEQLADQPRLPRLLNTAKASLPMRLNDLI